MSQSPFVSLVIFLTAAVICVPISKKLGLGSVLGYLIAGLLIGPHGFGAISNVEEVLHFSEFGVVLLLFIIGLELEPKKLWQMRVPIFGMGGIQVLANTSLITIISLLAGLTFSSALLIGMAFSLSSTAMALQILNEKRLLNTTAGQANFSILLFQDIAVIPMLAVLPLLVTQTEQSSGTDVVKILMTVGIILLTLVVGRLALRPFFRMIAGLHLREIFTAASLLLVVAMALLMYSLQISMALGAFLAGVLLADSEYKHALETDIEPFKGLLLGLFFIAVGMSVNLQILLNEPLTILMIVAVVYLLKSLVHWGIGMMFILPKKQIPFFSIVISQVGEFAFVLLGTGVTLKILEKPLHEKLLAAVALSMLATPLVSVLYDFMTKASKRPKEAQADEIKDENSEVIIAGFGRYGQIIGRLLHANKIKATVLDHEPDQIELVRKFGFEVYYGDATRLDLLESAGIEKAKALIIAIDDVEAATGLAKLAKQHFPNLKVFARARNIQHVFDLMDAKVDFIERETFESSLKMGTNVLQVLGWAPYDSVLAGHIFRQHNYKMLEELHKARNIQSADFVAQSKQAREDLEKLFEKESQIKVNNDKSWIH